MKEVMISTGEASKISGMTIRTLQHYDNIGILPASGRTEGGRRYYTENDIMKLEHVVFYRRLGFSLEQIKDQLLSEAMKGKVGEILSRQKVLLFNQIESLQNCIIAIEASEEIANAGKTPPWTLLSAFMLSLGTADLSAWSEFEFTDEQKQVFDEHLPTLDDVLEFYNTWKRLSIKSAAYLAAGIDPGEPIAQKLAADWIAMTLKANGGKEEHTAAYLEVDQNRSTWSPAERELIEKAEPYLEEVLKIYRSKTI